MSSASKIYYKKQTILPPNKNNQHKMIKEREKNSRLFTQITANTRNASLEIKLKISDFYKAIITENYNNTKQTINQCSLLY